VLLPPLTPFFPPPSPLPPSPLSGCVCRSGCSGGTATPAVIRDGPDGRTTKIRYGTASAAASAATEEEECNGCDGANPRRRLDDSLLRLADGILLRSIVMTTAGVTMTAVGSMAIATMSMPVINIGALFIGREDREDDDGSGVAAEDDDDTNAEAGGYARLGRAFWEEEDDTEDRDERARRRRRDAVKVRDALRGGAVVVVVHGSPEAPIAGDDRDEGGRSGSSVADKTITDGATTAATTERGMRR
jgi:hypothetical protein